MPKFHLTAPIAPQVADPDVERVVRELRAKVVELQRLPLAGAVIVKGVELEDGVPRAVPHRLGRPFVTFFHSPPRSPSTSGRIEDVRSSSFDAKQFVVLEANGFGATITVDVVVV